MLRPLVLVHAADLLCDLPSICPFTLPPHPLFLAVWALGRRIASMLLLLLLLRIY